MDDLDLLKQRLAAFRDAIISGCEDCWIFLVPSSLGEMASVCALSAAFKARHGGRICIVADQSRESIFHLFGDVDLMKFSDIHSMRALSSYGVLDPLKFELGYPQNLWVNQNRCGRALSLHELFINQPGRGGLSFLDMVRYTMNLPWDAPITKGRIGPDLSAAALQVAAAHGVAPGNSVVLFPGNNTNKPADAAFWNTLADTYAKSGKKVFYCLAGANFKTEGLNIQGVRLDMPPGLAVAVCDIAGHMVSGANGLMFLSLLTDTTFSMDVVLTDGADVVGNFVFTPVDTLSSSTFRCAPELLQNLPRRYSEWILDGTSGSPAEMAEAVAHVIEARSVRR